MESIASGIDEIKTAMRGFDSITDGFLREHRTVETVVGDVKSLTERVNDIEKDVEENSKDRERRHDLWKVVRDRALMIVVPAVMPGVVWLLALEFGIVQFAPITAP